MVPDLKGWSPLSVKETHFIVRLVLIRKDRQFTNFGPSKKHFGALVLTLRPRPKNF